LRALIFHGYLLRGTGSNVYNANLAQALVRLGWDVHLLCQERAAGELVHFIDRSPWVFTVFLVAALAFFGAGTYFVIARLVHLLR